jgi:hypothetical protein
MPARYVYLTRPATTAERLHPEILAPPTKNAVTSPVAVNRVERLRGLQEVLKI